MGRCIKPIGGEFWFQNNIINNSRCNLEGLKTIFLAGGQSAILYILNNLNIEKHECILLPSYICPSMLYHFKYLGINYRFYKINTNLSIDHQDLIRLSKCYNVKAIFFINYFGFYQTQNTIRLLEKFQKQGIQLIEDAVQMLWYRKQEFIGNYVFNSYRKFLPIDGSIVLCNRQEGYEHLEDDYDHLIYQARTKKTEFINNNKGCEEEYLDLFEKAEKAYYKRIEIKRITKESKNLLNKIDIELIGKIRLENYNYLYNHLIDKEKLKILYNNSNIKTNIPIGMPILTNNRDYIRTKLREYKIFCPVHWDLTKEVWVNDYPNSLYISKHILTIPIDHRYDKMDMDRFLSILFKLL